VDNPVARTYEIFIIIIIIIVIIIIVNISRITGVVHTAIGPTRHSLLRLGHGGQDAYGHCRVFPDLADDRCDLLQARIE
jgi:hypothetical protein